MGNFCDFLVASRCTENNNKKKYRENAAFLGYFFIYMTPHRLPKTMKEDEMRQQNGSLAITGVTKITANEKRPAEIYRGVLAGTFSNESPSTNTV